MLIKLDVSTAVERQKEACRTHNADRCPKCHSLLGISVFKLLNDQFLTLWHIHIRHLHKVMNAKIATYI